MKKRGQLTIFIIFAVVIALIIIGYFVISSNYTGPLVYDEEVNVLRENILDCLKQDYRFLAEYNSYQGGYNNRPITDVYPLGDSFIPYYYYEGKNYMPGIERLQNELNSGAKPLVQGCIQEYNNGIFSLSYDDFEVESTIYKDYIEFNNKVKLRTEYYNKTVVVDFDESIVTVDSNLLEMYELSEIIVFQALNDPQEWIDLTEIYYEATVRDLNVTIIDIDEDANSYLYIIRNNDQEFYPTSLQFLNKYNLYEVPFPENPEY